MSRNKQLATNDARQIASARAVELEESTIVLRGILLIVVAFMVGSALPALLAYCGNVFTQEDVYQRLPSEARKTVARAKMEQQEVTDEISRIDVALRAAEPGSETHHRLLESRQGLRIAPKGKPTTLQYYGYMGSQSPQFYYPLFFLTLGALVFLVAPPGSKRFRRRKLQTILMAAGIYASWQWFHWVRNFVAREEARIIYTYTNWDISPICYLYQELEALLISFLIATIWCQWLESYRTRISELHCSTTQNWPASLYRETTERLSKTFTQWQIASLLLAAAFSSFFAFYWKNIHTRGDSRYLVSALAIHVVGLVSWIIVSLPMTETWRHWHRLRAGAIYELATSADEIGRIELRTKMIDSVKPIGSWNLLISTTLLFASFALPIVQMVTR